MLRYIIYNSSTPYHILIIEDPIECIYDDILDYEKGVIKAVITHREVGVDTLGFVEALKGGLRQAPDVIIIGEITCVAEQIPVYPYTVKWEFLDWQYGSYKFSSTNFSSPFWRYTYSNFNFGELQITASFETTSGTVMNSDSIIVKK